MSGVAKAFAGLTAAGPAILDARETALVERDRTRRRVARAHDRVVLDDERDECDGGDGNPPGRDPCAPRAHDQQHRDRKRRKPRVTELLVRA